MRFLILGTGSIGQRHCRNLASLGHELLAWDADTAHLGELAATPGVRALSSVAHGLAEQPAGVLVCTPPSSHLDLAREALRAGADVFVEKPLSHTTDGAVALLAEANHLGRLIMVGFNLRFLESLRRAKQHVDDGHVGKVLSARAECGSYLPDWRPGRDYRANYAVRAEEGGGILLDAIHELDYLGWLFGPVAEIFCAAEHVSDLAGDTEDLAEVLIRFESGLLAQLHLDYVQRRARRNLQVIGDHATLHWDYPTHSVSVETPRGEPTREEFRAREGDPNRMYMDEIAHFARCVERRAAPPVDGLEALRSLRLAEAAKESAREGRWVKL
jgi:predicted dehydrogenase